MNEQKNITVQCGRFASRGEWTHPKVVGRHYELIFIIEGEAWISEEGVEYHLEEGDILVLEPGKEHWGYKVSKKKVSFYWLHFDAPWPSLDRFAKTMRLKDKDAVAILCRQITSYEVRKFGREVMNSLLFVLLSELERQTGIGMDDGYLPTRIHEWIRINSDKNIKVSDISRHFGYNVDYLSRIFRKAYGHTIKNEIDTRRLKEIRYCLMESNVTLYEISERFGFDDYKVFLKFFKYHEGMTPSEYRRAYHKMYTNNR